MLPSLLAVGIVVALITSFVQSLGLTLQRKAHISEGDQTWTWRTGFIIFILANLFGSTVQIAALPLAILAPLHASGLVYNAVLATFLLDEPFTYLAWIGTLLVAVGATLIAVFGAIEEPAHTLAQLLDLFAAPRFLSWMSIQVVLVLGIIVSVSFVSRTQRGKSESSRRIQGAALGVLAGILASHCLLLAKLTVELLVKTFGEGENQFTRPQAFFIPAALVCGALAQLYYLNRGLRMCSTSILYPLNFSIYNITTIVDGIIYYGEGSQLTPLHIGLVVLGVVLLLAGVLGLSWKLGHPTHHVSFVADDDDVSADECPDRSADLQLSIPGLYDIPAPAWQSPKSLRRGSAADDLWDPLPDSSTEAQNGRAHHSNHHSRAASRRRRRLASASPTRTRSSPFQASTQSVSERTALLCGNGSNSGAGGLGGGDDVVNGKDSTGRRRRAQSTPQPDNTPVRHIKSTWERILRGSDPAPDDASTARDAD